MAKPLPPERLDAFNGRQRAIIEAASEWGYLETGVCQETSLYRGRRMLDIGMGGGPYSVAFIFGGAEAYFGVDPKVGGRLVRDLRAGKDPNRPMVAEFPYSANDIMEAFPNIKLYSGLLEDFTQELCDRGITLITLSVVSEHLKYPDKVIKSAYDIADEKANIWISHCNYYSWVGHHGVPHRLEHLNISDAAHVRNMDWNHLSVDHMSYMNNNLNRMRLDDFHALIENYFNIIQWREHYDCAERLTPAIRIKLKKYTTSELLSRMVYVYGEKRSIPVGMDMSKFVFFHPDEGYRSDEDHCEDDDSHISDSNLVFFAQEGRIGGHAYNNLAADRIMSNLIRGDVITLQKYGEFKRVVVAEVLHHNDRVIIRHSGDAPEHCSDLDRLNWTIIRVKRGRSRIFPAARQRRAGARAVG